MSNPVLLLMDYQKDICEPKGAIGSSGTGGEVVRRGSWRWLGASFGCSVNARPPSSTPEWRSIPVTTA